MSPVPKERREALGARLSEPPSFGSAAWLQANHYRAMIVYNWELSNAQAERAGELLGCQAGWAAKVRAAGHQ